MSREKLTNSESTFDEVVTRVQKAIGADTQREVAESLGMSTGDFANRKKRGRVPLDRLAEFASSRSVSLDWLLTGEGEMYRTPRIGDAYAAAPKPGDALKAARFGKTAGDSAVQLTPRQQAVLELFESLAEDDQREILRDAEEKKRLSELEKHYEELRAEVERLKNLG